MAGKKDKSAPVPPATPPEAPAPAVPDVLHGVELAAHEVAALLEGEAPLSKSQWTAVERKVLAVVSAKLHAHFAGRFEAS